MVKPKYFDQLSGESSTQKLVKIHNSFFYIFGFSHKVVEIHFFLHTLVVSCVLLP